MYNKHFFCVNNSQLNSLTELLTNKIDNQFIVVQDYGDYSDIAQYSSKYDNVKFVCVKTDNLDISNRLF